MKRVMLLCAMVVFCSSAALAVSPRGGVELFAIGHYDAGTESDASLGTSSATLSMDDGFGVGGGVGLNFGPFVNLNFNAVWAMSDMEVNIDGLFSDATLEADRAHTIHLSANVEIYPIDGPVTPLVGGGVGLINIASDLEDDDISESNFAYNFTAGVRWDIDDHWFLKLQYRIIFFEFEDSEDTDPIHAAELALGWRF